MAYQLIFKILQDTEERQITNNINVIVTLSPVHNFANIKTLAMGLRRWIVGPQLEVMIRGLGFLNFPKIKRKMVKTNKEMTTR